MNSDLQVSNRLHRSGAIDYNVSFDLNTAGSYTQSANKRKWFESDGGDSLSVCEGEPIYCKKKLKKNRFSLQSMGRSPLEALSSVNGFSCEFMKDDAIESLNRKASTMQREKNVSREIALCEVLRDAFFSEVKYTGIAVSPWSYGRKGKQGELFVATLGGANTIYVDEDVEAGDTLVVDCPQINSTNLQEAMKQTNCDVNSLQGNASVGFIKWQHKKGMPKKKQTLVVRKLPTFKEPNPTPEILKEYRLLRQNFFRRGQVVGMCTRGALAGERADVVLGHNCLGVWNSADLGQC